MNIFEKLWLKIVSSNDKQYIDKIEELQLQVKELENLRISWKNKYKEQQEAYNDLNNKYNDIRQSYLKLQENYDELLNPEEGDFAKPDIIDTSEHPYFPSWLVFYYDNNDIQTKKVNLTPSKFYKIWSDEMWSYFREKTKGLKKFDSIVVKLRDIITNRTKYETDVIRTGKAGENWRLPTETFYGKLGDCEDTTILWVTACKICGISPDRVFNATGYMNNWGKEIGHSFGIAKFDDGEWYVIETTSKKKPVKLKDSNYKVEGFLNGLTNWEFSGKSKQSQF